MGCEYINRITIKKDGVYVSTKSSNDDMPYHSVRLNTLSEIYAKQGQEALDREIIAMCSDYCQLRGSHKSLDRYRYALDDNSLAVKALKEKYLEAIDEKYDTLSESDKKTRWKPAIERTPAMNEYLKYCTEQKRNLCDKLTERCEEYDLKHKEKTYDLV